MECPQDSDRSWKMATPSGSVYFVGDGEYRKNEGKWNSDTRRRTRRRTTRTDVSRLVTLKEDVAGPTADVDSPEDPDVQKPLSLLLVTG